MSAAENLTALGLAAQEVAWLRRRAEKLEKDLMERDELIGRLKWELERAKR